MSNPRNYFVHDKGLCESQHIGRGASIGAFSHVSSGARIGSETQVCNNVFIENDVVIGDRVILQCGVQVWDGMTIEDDVFVGPNVTFTNDRFPTAAAHPLGESRTIVRKGASLGANSTILGGITIGVNAMIGAGSMVTRSIPPNAIVEGNPAKIIGYVDAKPNGTTSNSSILPSTAAVTATSVKGVTLHNMNEVTDIRGNLSVGEFNREIPFIAQRYFLVYGVPTAETRGEHAHHKCHQFLVAIKVTIHVVADDGENREELILDKPNLGLYLPPMTWGIQYRYSSDAVLMVFASDYYDSSDYIRNYDDFAELVSKKRVTLDA